MKVKKSNQVIVKFTESEAMDLKILLNKVAEPQLGFNKSNLSDKELKIAKRLKENL